MLELKKVKKPAKIAASTGGGMSQSPFRPQYVEKSRLVWTLVPTVPK